MTTRDDNPGHPRPSRRLRVDESTAGFPEPRARSGRRVVIVAGLILAVLWGTLYLVFRDWRSRYRARAAFGARAVAPAIDPLADVVPDGVDPRAWHQAVADSHAMLVTLTASNLLDLGQMRALHADVAARVGRAHAHPGTAPGELAGLWNDLSDRAGPIILNDRHPRPKLLPPRPVKDPRLMRVRGRTKED